MSASVDGPSSARLLWQVADYEEPTREETVPVVGWNLYEATVSSSVQFLSDTEVCLIAAGISDRHGVVQACRAEGTRFILTIRLANAREPDRPSDRDPGFLVVNEFVTEEDELRILQEVEAELAETQDPKSLKAHT